MTDYQFAPNATVLKDCFGVTPFILGCDQERVEVQAGTRVEVLDSCHSRLDPTQAAYKVRLPANEPGCFWTLWLGMSGPVSCQMD